MFLAPYILCKFALFWYLICCLCILSSYFCIIMFQRVLNLMGNPVIKKIKNYRKILTVKCVSIATIIYKSVPIGCLLIWTPTKLIKLTFTWKLTTITVTLMADMKWPKVLFNVCLPFWHLVAFLWYYSGTLISWNRIFYRTWYDTLQNCLVLSHLKQTKPCN